MEDSAGSQMSRRWINKVITSNRTVSHNVMQVTYHQYQDHTHVVAGPCELDSHADTCVTGTNCVILEVTRDSKHQCIHRCA
jgi:hypothetical protein